MYLWSFRRPALACFIIFQKWNEPLETAICRGLTLLFIISEYKLAMADLQWSNSGVRKGWQWLRLRVCLVSHTAEHRLRWTYKFIQGFRPCRKCVINQSRVNNFRSFKATDTCTKEREKLRPVCKNTIAAVIRLGVVAAFYSGTCSVSRSFRPCLVHPASLPVSYWRLCSARPVVLRLWMQSVSPQAMLIVPGHALLVNSQIICCLSSPCYYGASRLLLSCLSSLCYLR